MKILVVDGDRAAGQRLGEWLVGWELGEVALAETAAGAAEQVNAWGTLDALLTRVALPDLDGVALFEAMRAELPDLPVIFLAADKTEAAGVAGWPVLVAPFDEQGLWALVQGWRSDVDPLVGGTCGEFQILERLGTDADGPFYRAVQTAISREVELHLLATERGDDAAEVARFLEAARAKARVTSPAVLSVFQAGSADGRHFYASEPRPPDSLATLAAGGGTLPAPALLQVLHVVADAMVQLGQARLGHESLRPEHVVIDARHRARLVNIAAPEGVAGALRDDLHGLAGAVRGLAPTDPSAGALLRLLDLMAGDGLTVRSWAALLYEVKRCQGSTGSEKTYRLDASGQEAIRALGVARKRERIRRWVGLGVAGGLGLAFLAWAAWFFLVPRLGNPALEQMVAIPGDLGTFWLDRHEVSIGQYADFLAWTQRNPGTAARLLPDGTPDGHSFVPEGWDERKTATGTEPGFFAAARAGGTYEGTALTLDSPVFGVDWASAFAYALWKNRRLPTQEEWARAARSVTAKRAAGSVARWLAVNDPSLDQSSEGVVGLGANVSEWTGSLINDNGRILAVVAGGNPDQPGLDAPRQMIERAIDARSPTIGFRTASSQAPNP